MKSIKRSETGKKLITSTPSLFNPRDIYRRPDAGKAFFETTTTIWHIDELAKRRVRDWKRLLGETGQSGTRHQVGRKDDTVYTGTYSVFPPPLMEWILVRYGGPAGGKVLDPFSGGPPRGLVSAIMGYQYTGFDVRLEQIEENLAAVKRLKLDGVRYIHGDGTLMSALKEDGPIYDVGITCPPYYDVEVYSDQPDDISALGSYEEFNGAMLVNAICCFDLLKPGAFFCIIIANFRDKKTKQLVDFRAHTVQNMQDAGFLFWQDVILSKNFGSAAKRSTNAWKGLKLVPRHEHLLVFRKPEK